MLKLINVSLLSRLNNPCIFHKLFLKDLNNPESATRNLNTKSFPVLSIDVLFHTPHPKWQMTSSKNKNKITEASVPFLHNVQNILQNKQYVTVGK